MHSVPKNIRWVTAARTPDYAIETAYFKTIFQYDGGGPQPKCCTLHISANNRYTLYVNGIEVLNGPCRADTWHQYCDEIDCTPYLKPGPNVVAAKVVAYPPFEAIRDDASNAGPFWCVANGAGPALIAWCTFSDAGDPPFELGTGVATWYCRNDDAIRWSLPPHNHFMGCTEDVDGAKIPWGWQTDPNIGDGFYEAPAKWRNAMEYGEIPKLLLYDRPIPYMLREKGDGLTVMAQSTGVNYDVSEGSQTVLPPHGHYEIILDAHRLVTAFVYLRCEGGRGSRVSLLFSEAFVQRDKDGKMIKADRADMSGELPGCADVYRPNGGAETYSPSWFRTFRFIKITLETADEALTVYPIAFTETRFPLTTELKFEATEGSWLPYVWDISLRTLQLCMHETYEDCPFYEQMQYTMDTRLQMLYTYAIGGGTDMPRKTIQDYHNSLLPEGIIQSRFPTKYPQVIPLFALHWIFMLRDYYFETGDLQSIRPYRFTMESILDWFKRKTGPHGLVEYLGYWDFADWTPEWRRGVPNAVAHGPAAVHNLVYAKALEEAGSLMKVMGYTQMSDIYRAEAEGIKTRVHELCWNETKKMYREGPTVEEYSQQTQVWAVLSGLAQAERAKQVMTGALADKTLVQCSFAMQYYLFRALEQAGMYEDTEKLWALWKHLEAMNLTTIPETPGNKPRSDCHAWGALMLYELPRKFLGVAPRTPGYSTIYIRPIGYYLAEIKGEVPTPQGVVSVRWQIANGMFRLEGFTPVAAEIILPNGTRHKTTGGRFAFRVPMPEMR